MKSKNSNELEDKDEKLCCFKYKISQQQSLVKFQLKKLKKAAAESDKLEIEL